jgi:histidine ammonia-lyase
MTTIVLTGAGFAIADIVALARGGAALAAAPQVGEKLRRARKILETAAAAGQKIYGLNTGLGANLNTSVAGDFAAFQRQLVRGRAMGLGASLPSEIVRAVIAARLAMLAVGGSGISPSTFEALAAMLNARVHPLIPAFGSIGAGDLVMLAAMARALIGEGQAEYGGQIHEAAEALALAGLRPVTLAPKDGLSLMNASAVSVGQGALAIADAQKLFVAQRRAAALSFEALGGNPLILSPPVQRARPAAGQAEEAAAMLAMLEGSSLFETQVALQDPLSLRCVASIHGALSAALQAAEEAVEIELNSASDNPLVLVEEGVVLSTGNFHTASLALRFETLGLAIAQGALASAARFIQLTGSARHGLPRYLSPVGGASAGFVPMQKTVTALAAALRHKANPILLDFHPVSEGVEDHATQSVLVVQKSAEMLDLWRQLIACEMLAAAQGVDLRPGHRCGQGVAPVHAFVRRLAPRLDEDRPLGEDAAAIAERLLSDDLRG